jgi:hypothetical protein
MARLFDPKADAQQLLNDRHVGARMEAERTRQKGSTAS